MDIELTSTREDGTWTWRAAGARQPRGTVSNDLVPEGSGVGDVLKAELEGFLDGMEIVSIQAPKQTRSEPEKLELIGAAADGPLVTTTRVSGGRRPGKGRRPQDRRERDRDGDRGRSDDRRERGGGGRNRDRERGRERDGEDRRSGPPPDARPKPKRLRPGRTHRNALLESLKSEERPVAEQVLQGGIPAVRQAIKKQNEELRAEKKPEVNADALLQLAERLHPRLQAAAWRDRADAALKNVEELDLRDLRSVVNAAGDAGRDDESREVADRLRAALATRIEAEQAAWLAEVAESLRNDRVVRALRLSSRPPKAGSPLPGDLTQQLIAATTAALTAETGPQRWATVLDALAYSPIRRRVVPDSLPDRLTPDLRRTIAQLATRLPEIAHIFDISPDEAPAKPRQPRRRGGPGQKGQGSGTEKQKGAKRKGDGAKAGKTSKAGEPERTEPAAAATAEPEPAEDRPGPGSENGSAAASGTTDPEVNGSAPETDPVEAEPVAAEPVAPEAAADVSGDPGPEAEVASSTGTA